MVNRLSIVLVFSTASIIGSEPEVPKQNIPKQLNGTIHLSINVNNRQDTQSHAQSNSSASASQINKQQEQIKDCQFMNKISELWEKQLKIQQQIQQQGSQFITTNKWYLCIGAVAGLYAYLAYLIVNGNKYLSDNNLWSSWHQELPLDQLLAIPQHQLTQELIREIQRRYTDPSSIIDIVKPLGLFMVKSDQEEEQLKWYQSAYSWLSYLRLNKLVPINQNRFGKITERLQRLAYFKNLFKSWTADYQLQQAERMWYRSPNEYVDLNQIAQLFQIEMSLKIIDYWLQKKQNCIPKP